MASSFTWFCRFVISCVIGGLTADQSTRPPNNIKFSYGVRSLPPGGGQHHPRRYPWPRLTGECSAYQAVRYCFKDHRSADNLGPIVMSAVSAWSQAMEQSALRIILDPECEGDPHKLCDELVENIDALMVSDETRDGDDEWNWGECETSTITGYLYLDGGELPDPGRHHLEFCHLIPGEERSTPFAVQAMTHEFGHAIGLQHEHQRPDRDEYLRFNCENLVGYEEARVAANIDEEVLFDDDDDDLDAKMSRVCSEYLFAKAYFPAAVPWLKGDHMDGGILHEDTTEMWRGFRAAGPFDYDSIMMYNSNANCKNLYQYAIVRWDNQAPVWQGGSPRPADVRVSAGDVANVARLYPLQPVSATVPRPTIIRMFIRDEL